MVEFTDPSGRLDRIFYPSNYDEFVKIDEFFSITGINRSSMYVGIMDGEGKAVFTEIVEDSLGDGIPDESYAQRRSYGAEAIKSMDRKLDYVTTPKYHYKQGDWLAVEICPKDNSRVSELPDEALREFYAVQGLIADGDAKLNNLAIHPEKDEICYFDLDRACTSKEFNPVGAMTNSDRRFEGQRIYFDARSIAMGTRLDFSNIESKNRIYRERIEKMFEEVEY